MLQGGNVLGASTGLVTKAGTKDSNLWDVDDGVGRNVEFHMALRHSYVDTEQLDRCI